jgi:hypothetical protein
MRTQSIKLTLGTLLLMSIWFWAAVTASESEHAVERAYVKTPAAPAKQTLIEASDKSQGCLSCHTGTQHNSMHRNPGVILGCTDCHGGDAKVMAKSGKWDETAKHAAHVLPKFPVAWHYPSAANPEQTYTLLNREAPEYIRFINPGDLRVARESCGACHLPIIQANERSLMSTSAMLWGGAAYNNGILPYKRYILGEAYTNDGKPAALKNPVPVNEHMTAMGILPGLSPLPAWETTPPADVFRVFERGGRVINTQFPEIGLPNNTGVLQKLDEPGRPDLKQSNRGPGTGSRIAVPVLNMTKTRLNDPHLWFLGTNDQPGDYRSSGCSACHSVYANDRDPKHSGPYAKFGNTGQSQSNDETISKESRGHPLTHQFSRAIPSSQCMVCHMHQPNIFVNSYFGNTMWDYEADAPKMWPAKQKYPTAAEKREVYKRNPEGAAPRGNWGDPKFLDNVSKLNPTLKDTQFADYHGHGWNFRAIFKRDRKGTLLDKVGNSISDEDPKKFEKGVHLTSAHLDAGMHCVDCHFAQDTHGNGHIYGEVAAAIEITCKDCHGTSKAYPNLFTSGPASPQGGTDMKLMRTQDGQKRFEWRGDKLFQRSAVTPGLIWEMSLVKDSITPGNANYNAKAARAKTMSKGEAGRKYQAWGAGVSAKEYAHDDEEMTCHSCHSSWTTSCSGCHLPIEANAKTPRLHYEGGETRNYATYNPQVVRDDIFMLGKAGSVSGGKITPVRSSSALVLSSTNINREKIYIQQPPISASGFSSQAFAPHYPHTERKTETKTCSDCHLSNKNDNNAIMAQLMMQGTNFVNFVGYNAWLGLDQQVAAVQVTEWDEPQSVIGSYLQKYAYPDWYQQHQALDKSLSTLHSAQGEGATHCLTLRGEYLFAAQDKGGLRIYDVASIANKGVSQKIITAPFSPLGQTSQIASKQATCVALPTNQPIAPERNQGVLMRETNQEQPFHPIYHYAFITDAIEGLILVNVDTLADGEPRNNVLKRALTWNPNGALSDARHITIGGHYVYVTTKEGVVIVDVDNPLEPKVIKILPLRDARFSALQFRYLFVTTANGVEVIDVTHPEKPKHYADSTIALTQARGIYLARTYAYVAAGKEGLAIIDIENPLKPKLVEKFSANGKLNDAQDVVVGSTNASLFAYVADGANGLKVLQLTSPDSQPKFYGFSPEPKPELIAWRATPSKALSVAKGLDRDRAVDETGHQIAVFGRIGSRPLSNKEMRAFYLNPDGSPWYVDDALTTSPAANKKVQGSR